MHYAHVDMIYLPRPMDGTWRQSTKRMCHPRSSNKPRSPLEAPYARTDAQIVQESEELVQQLSKEALNQSAWHSRDQVADRKLAAAGRAPSWILLRVANTR